MIRCGARPTRWSDLAAALLPGRGPELWNDASYVPVHSGKAGLNHIFSYLRSLKVLEDKNSKILTPPGLGSRVYNALRPHGFPVLHDDPEIKAAVVLHQYGFPQDLDEIKDACSRRGLVFVEDCTQALGGTRKERPLGRDGLAGVFSLSKFRPCLTGGAVRSGDAALRAHIARLEEAGSRALGLLGFAVKLAASRATDAASVVSRLDEAGDAAAPYCRRVRWAERICALDRSHRELELRRRNYRLYRELLPGLEELQRLEADVVPWVVPLMHPRPGALAKIGESLTELGVDARVRLFDAGRNLFKPRYVPCIPLPVHGGLDEERVARIAAAVGRSA